VKEMLADAQIAAAQIEFFAGLVTEVKGASIPMGPDIVNFSVREPRGVVGRIIPFNHPFMFCAGKSAAALATGNTIVVKPPEQAPMSSLRLAELCKSLRQGMHHRASTFLTLGRWLAVIMCGCRQHLMLRKMQSRLLSASQELHGRSEESLPPKKPPKDCSTVAIRATARELQRR
jgi:hypothetical protein